MKITQVAFVLVLFVALAVGLELAYRYHFFFIEQNGLFLFTGHYFSDMLTRPGGVASWVAEFLIQFFTLPWAGALITALLLATSALLTVFICRRLAPRVSLYFLWALPALSLLCIQLDLNYLWGGTIAFLAMQAVLLLYIRLPRGSVRLAAGLISVPLLFWWCGSVAVLFAVCAVICETENRHSKWYLSLAVVAEAALVACGLVHFSILGDAGLALTPKLYYPIGGAPGPEIWFAWAAMVVVLVAARLFRGLHADSSTKREFFVAVPQLLLVAIIGWWATTTFIDTASYRMKTVDYFARHGRWDDVIAASEGPLNNYLHLNYLNLALAEKGILADELFRYRQHGPNSLFVSWNGSLRSAIVTSDVQFAIGNISIAQKMAFVGNVLTGNLQTPGYGSPRLLQRLVQVSLVYGLYPVAEKYLGLLSQTMFYNGWARDHRRFLYDDRAVSADPLLGEKRRCLLDESFLSTFHPNDLEAIALQNPSNRMAIEYLGSYLLLSKDMPAFRTMIETYYGTELLPTLPRSFKEAVMIIYENDPEAWEHYGVSREISNRVAAFQREVSDSRGRSDLAGVLRRSYGDTYWFYYMFEQL